MAGGGRGTSFQHVPPNEGATTEIILTRGWEIGNPSVHLYYYILSELAPARYALFL